MPLLRWVIVDEVLGVLGMTDSTMFRITADLTR